MIRLRGIIVAIDGPAGAGKSTLARRVAADLGYTLVDTGALYRAVALRALDAHLELDDGPAIGQLARAMRMDFVAGELEVDGTRPGPLLRTNAMGIAASRVSSLPEVRDALLGVQRDLGREGGVVLEGRDIGTVVYPDAELKIFLVASDDERARRRLAELTARGESSSLEAVRASLFARDTRDAARAIAPLRKADDAIEIDTTGRAIDDLAAEIVELAMQRTRRD